MAENLKIGKNIVKLPNESVDSQDSMYKMASLAHSSNQWSCKASKLNTKR
ncbi:hypothetical protein U062_01650 [Gammaproteobacteria bacterium MOLA455]|nr:hypothetical protein U062_01650 [Gammaproteobacteria bacterium MOLA455]